MAPLADGSNLEPNNDPYGGNTTNSAPGAEKPRAQGGVLNNRWRDLNAKQRAQFEDKADFSAARAGLRRAQEGGANATNASRMAGERLRDANAAGDEGAIARQKDRIYGDIDSFDASAAGAGGAEGKNRISNRDVKELVKRHGREAVYNMLSENAQGSKIGGRGQRLLANYTDELTESPVDPDQPDPGQGPVLTTQAVGENGGGSTTPTPELQQPDDQVPMPGMPQAPPRPPSMVDSGNQTQVNDIDQTNNSNVEQGDISIGGNVGDGNIIGHRNYGGDQSNVSINVQGGADSGEAARLLTLSGHGKPSDSPAANASFVDMYSDMNDLNQQKYSGLGSRTAGNYIEGARSTNPVDMMKLNEAINSREGYHEAMSNYEGLMAFGDLHNHTPRPFSFAAAADPVDTSPVTDAAEDAYDRMDDED